MNQLFILFFALYPVMVITLLQKSGFSILRLGTIQFVSISLFFFGFLGTLPLYFGWDEYRVSLGVNDQYLVFKVMMFSGITMLLFIVGAVSAKTVFYAPATLNKFNRIHFNKKEIQISFLFFLFVLVVLAVYLSKIPDVALFVAVTEGAQEAALARSRMGNEFPGKYHWYSLIMHDLANVITFSFFSAFLITKKKQYSIAFFLSFLVSSFTALMATEKVPFVWLIIGLFLAYVATKRNGQYPLKQLITLFVLVLTAVALSYLYFTDTPNLLNAFSNVFSRAFGGSIQPAYHYLEFFPEHQDFLLGTSFPNPGGLLPFEPYRLTREVMNWVDPSGAKIGVVGSVGSMPTVLWGEAYANFGYLGITIIPFLIGFLVFTIDYFVSKIADTPLKIGLYVWLVLHYSNLANAGFSKFILDIYLFSIIAICLLIFSLSNNLKIKTKSSV